MTSKCMCQLTHDSSIYVCKKFEKHVVLNKKVTDVMCQLTHDIEVHASLGTGVRALVFAHVSNASAQVGALVGFL